MQQVIVSTSRPLGDIERHRMRQYRAGSQLLTLGLSKGHLQLSMDEQCVETTRRFMQPIGQLFVDVYNDGRYRFCNQRPGSMPGTTCLTASTTGRQMTVSALGSWAKRIDHVELAAPPQLWFAVGADLFALASGVEFDALPVRGRRALVGAQETLTLADRLATPRIAS